MQSGKIIFVAICSRNPSIGYFDKTNGSGKRYLVCLAYMGQRYDILSFFKMTDRSNPRFSHQEGTKPQKQPHQTTLHANVRKRRHLVCPSSSSEARDIIFKMADGAILDLANRKVPTQK